MIHTKLEDINVGDIVGVYTNLGSGFKSFKIVKIVSNTDHDTLSPDISILKVSTITYINSTIDNGMRKACTYADYPTAVSTYTGILYMDDFDELFIIDDDEIEHMVIDLI